MVKNLQRKHKHEAFFYEAELAALAPVFTRLGKALGDFPKETLRDLLCLHYNLPASERGDASRVLAGCQLAVQTLGTIRRHETCVHTKNAEFRSSVSRLIDGDPDGATYEEVAGLQGLIDGLRSFALRGY